MSADRLELTLFINDEIGVRVTDFLVEDPSSSLVRVIVNDAEKRRLPLGLQELRERWGVPVESHADAWDVDGQASQSESLGVSVLFGHILSGSQLSQFTRGVINCHPSLLPYNRGAFPAAWSILDGTPSGVTIHLMDEGLDTGAILAQETVDVRESDTSGSLYARTLERLYETFTTHWSHIRDGKVQPIEQVGKGTYHSSRDFHQMREFRITDVSSPGELFDRLRAASLLDGSGARVTLESGNSVEISVNSRDLN